MGDRKEERGREKKIYLRANHRSCHVCMLEHALLCNAQTPELGWNKGSDWGLEEGRS
jgi:hypothetical protein